MSHTRKSLADVLGGSTRDDLARQFDEAEAAGELVTLPRGTYRCRLTDGVLDTSKGGTPGYVLTFTVDDGEYRGRKVWSTLWLTPAAMPMTKRDFAKLGIVSLDMLERPLPPGIVCDVRVVVRADDDGVERNKVASFAVVEVLADATADADFASPAPSVSAPSPAARASPPAAAPGTASAKPSPAVGKFVPGQRVLPCVEPPAGDAA